MIRIVLMLLFAWSPGAAAVSCAPDELSAELLRRKELDQSARKALLSTSPQAREDIDRVLRIDSENTQFMRMVVESCDWPTVSAVGEEAARAAWLLTQHADMDPEYQVIAARKLKVAVMRKEASALHLALLVDRNRRLNDQPQVYGYQYSVGTDGTVRFFDIVTPSQLNARRKEVGLPPFYCIAVEASKRNGGAAVEWPDGVLFVPVDCADGT